MTVDFATFQTPVSSPVSVLKSMRDDEHNGFHLVGRNVFIVESPVSGKRKLPYIPVHVAHESSTGSSVVIDMMVCRPDMDTSAVISDVRGLARELTKTDTLSFGFLSCRGVVKNHRPIRTEEGGEDTPVLAFDFIFAVPQFLSEPRSLRELLLLRDKHPFRTRRSSWPSSLQIQSPSPIKQSALRLF